MDKVELPYEPTREELEAFIKRAGFDYGWRNLESWARRMAEEACRELQLARVQLALAGVPKRLNSMRLGDNDVIFADIRAAFVDKDGTITRTLNGSTMPPGTDLYVLGDLIK